MNIAPLSQKKKKNHEIVAIPISQNRKLRLRESESWFFQSLTFRKVLSKELLNLSVFSSTLSLLHVRGE